MSCCICQFSVRNPKNIYEETIGKPPILVSDLVQQCTKGTNFVLSKSSATVCNKCRGKLARYHKSLQVAQKLRQEIIELIRSPLIIKNLKTLISSVTKSDKFDGNVEVDETVDAADSDDGYEAVETLLNSSTEAEAEVEDNIIEETTSDCDEEEYQAVGLDIDNEIIINKEVPEPDIEEEEEDEEKQLKCTKRIRTC